MNKKFFVIFLALSLLFAVSLPIFAENLESDSQTVTVSVDADGNGVPDDQPGGITDPTKLVYSYDLTWESLNFTYRNGTWDAELGTYKGGSWQVQTDGVWADDASQDITVTNKSNASITVKATMAADPKYGVDASISGDATSATGVTLPSAASAAVVNGTESTTTVVSVGVSGHPTVSEGFSVGTITVTISK